MGMDAASGVSSGALESSGVNVAKEAGGNLQQQVAVEAAADQQEQQQQQGQNAIELIQSSGIGQNVNVQA